MQELSAKPAFRLLQAGFDDGNRHPCVGERRGRDKSGETSPRNYGIVDDVLHYLFWLMNNRGGIIRKASDEPARCRSTEGTSQNEHQCREQPVASSDDR